jgi:molecular chaperone HtpG
MESNEKMAQESEGQKPAGQEAIPFRAETRQLLNILIHSLYTDHEVFLRELISNASDAITRLNFEMLTNRDVVDADAELGIWITTNPEEKTITVRDTGIGMTREELIENLGTIAHSSARAFIQAAQEAKAPVSEIIGQFGVGFYSAFMVADSIRVTSRSFHKDSTAYTWFSNGEDTYTLEAADKADRGTIVTIKLKPDEEAFLEESRIREIIKKHSDFIPFPIYLGKDNQLVNQRTALWRQSPREVEATQYDDFYRQFTLEFEAPITSTHLVIDAPVQLYALLYVPSTPEKGMFTTRKEDGLKLYARKVLIQEYSRDLLPEYYRFIQGVVDSEDIQLNVSRESIQSSRVMAQIKRALTGKVTDMLKKLAADQPEDEEKGYPKFWKNFSRFIKEGIATDRESMETLAPLLRYHTLNHPDHWVSLDDYILNLKPDQKKIYYILGDDDRSVIHSPHLDVFRHSGVDVLLMTDPLDSFTLMSLTQYKDLTLVNAAAEKPEVPADEKPADENQEEKLPEEALTNLVQRFKDTLGERISDVRTTDRLIDSPARLVDKEGSMNQEVQRVYRMLHQDFEVPQKVLEINPQHPILRKLNEQPVDGPLNNLIIEQIYEDALLIEGLHPDPAGMIGRIQELMKAVLK